jgi:2-polyprenyl-3-methyl-5-hydroxy-6-metoxy-1,4-benzoquinol methylase
MTALRQRLQRRFWDAHARGWDQMRSEPGVRAQIDAVTRSLGTHLPPGGAVLDLGCGAGQHAIELAAAGFEVTAVDYSAAMLQRARANAVARGVDVDFRLADLAGDWSPTTAGRFDGAICVSVLQVLQDPSRMLEEVRTILGADGYLLVESVRELGALSRGRHLGPRDRAVNALKSVAVKLWPAAVSAYEPGDIARMLEASAFSVVEVSTYESTFTVLGRKQSR